MSLFLGDSGSWVEMINTNILGYLHTMSVFLPMTKKADNRQQLRWTGIKITQVEPGAVRTEGVLKLMEDPTFEVLHEKFYPKSKDTVDKAMTRDKMVAKDIGEVVWDAIKTVDRAYVQEVYVGNKE